MNKTAFQARTRELLIKERAESCGWWYLSFADDKFLGAIIMRGYGPVDCQIAAIAMGLNPGGEVKAFPIPEDKIPDAKFTYRLLRTRAEIEKVWNESVESTREYEERTGKTL